MMRIIDRIMDGIFYVVVGLGVVWAAQIITQGLGLL